MIKYACAIIDQHLAQNFSEKILPLVIPIVFYNGVKPYPFSLNILDLFGENKNLIKNILSAPFKLIDLTQLSDETIHTHPWVGLMESVMKHAPMRDTAVWLERALQQYIEFLLANDAEKYVEAMLEYTLNQGNITDAQNFMSVLHRYLNGNEKLEKKMGILAQQFRKEGWQEGLSQGLSQGMIEGQNKGVQIGKAEILEELLQEKFGILPSQNIQEKLAKASPELLKHWCRQVLYVNTLDEVFK